MSAYICHVCDGERTTENMAAVCAHCHHKIKEALSSRTVSCANCNEMANQDGEWIEALRLSGISADDRLKIVNIVQSRSEKK